MESHPGTSRWSRPASIPTRCGAPLGHRSACGHASAWRLAAARAPCRRPAGDGTRPVARARGRRRRPRPQGRRGPGPPVPRSPGLAVHRVVHGGRRRGRVSLAGLDCRAMIYVCVPVHNEARTAGLVLWKVRQVFTAFPREYQLLVLDDASTDETPVVLASYAKVLPMTIVTHRAREGYARSLEELLRLALQRTDRPKRDCAITLHADFAHSPESMEDMVKRLESGADLVVAEQVEERGRGSRALRWS